MLPDRYVWLVWSSAFLIPWGVLYWRFPEQRRAMWWASLFTAPFGLTEPLFVPEYWDPPTPGYIERVWNFAALTGIRLGPVPVEELLFAFGFGSYWSGVYEHVTWHRTRPKDPGA